MGNALAFNKVRGKSSAEINQHPNKQRIGSLPPDMSFGGLERFIGSNKDEELLAEILEKIRKPFEDLESLVANLREDQRTIYICGEITASLLSSDPVNTLQASVDITRAFKLKKNWWITFQDVIILIRYLPKDY